MMQFTGGISHQTYFTYEMDERGLRQLRTLSEEQVMSSATLNIASSITGESLLCKFKI